MGRCALRLGIATAVTLPLLARLTEVSADASLSVLGFDAFGAGVELRGRLGTALACGALWGVGAGAVGGWLAWVCGAAGARAVPVGTGTAEVRGEAAVSPGAGAGPYAPGAPYRPPNPGTNPYLRLPEELREPRGGEPEPEDAAPPARRDASGAPTVAGPLGRPPGRKPRTSWGDGPPPPPPPPPVRPPKRPKG